ncbi:MAG: penicillin-binding transpeptidase domain-containing protein [Chlamydiales bacterium]|nr:penicillin-binding transpeptidase domain-containing protein [Chlamydiales bacterium]
MRRAEIPSISKKTNFVLRIILVGLFLIIFRLWHLSVIQREEKVHKAEQAQRKTHLLRANRGTISDRYHVPLALNRICYNATIYYNQIAQIPASSWKIDSFGGRQKIFPRKEYIAQIASLLAKELGLTPQRVEDEIHSKASLFPHAPYVIKANICEEEHSRLCQLERSWPGLHAEITSERFYPLGKIGADLIGTMGSISAREYKALAEEMNVLQEAKAQFEEGFWEDLPKGYTRIEDVYRRLHELKEKSYTLNDRVGKTGIEAQFEEALRGYMGKKSVEIDQQGRFVRELPSSYPPIAGSQVLLSLSAELQQFAEELLIQHEKTREGRSLGFDSKTRQHTALKQPWIKGGAIVAMDPQTGEILAMASYPRYDPNDFILSGQDRAQKTKRLQRWLESEEFIADLWDGKQPFLRERIDRGKVYEEAIWLSWDCYLEQILPKDKVLIDFFHRFDTVKAAIELQEDVELALYHTKQSDPAAVFDQLPKLAISLQKEDPKAAARIKKLESALQSLPSNQDKLFVIDLSRLIIHSAAFSDELIHKMGSIKLSHYFSLHQALQQSESIAKEVAKKQFHEGPFQAWREEHQKTFLAKKRAKEELRKTYARPYLTYLDQKEEKLFRAHWAERRLEALADLLLGPTCPKGAIKLQESLLPLSKELQLEWLKTFRSYKELARPLLGSYKRVRKPYIEKHLAAAFYPIGGFGFNRSCSFQATAPPGSLFKLVSAYTALSQQITSFSMIDEQKTNPKAPPSKREIVGYSLDKTPYPRHYKGGRLPKSHAPHIGKVDLLGALEQSSNPYFSLLAGEFFSDPEDLRHSASLFGFGERSGIDLPNEAKGTLPTDLRTNRTGLYSFAIGQHTALATPLQAACMLSALANGGHLVQPKLASTLIGPAPNRSALEPFCANNYLAKEELGVLGVPFSLFTSAQTRSQNQLISKRPTIFKRNIPLPPSIQNSLLEGMDRGVWGTRGSARANAIRSLLGNPRLMKDYLSLQHQMIGKTSTSEISINLDINPSSLAKMYKHIWFGSIALSAEKHKKKQPELVVVVFLRYADGGKEAAPLAAQVIHKWREIQGKHENAMKHF